MQPVPLALPPAWFTLFDGENLAAKSHHAALLASVDEEGWPHVSFLGVGEILAGEGDVRLATWPRAGTSANLERERRAVLYAAFDGMAWEMRLGIVAMAMVDGLMLSRATIVAVRRHEAPYAVLETLAGFALKKPDEALARWTRQIAGLRAAFA